MGQYSSSSIYRQIKSFIYPTNVRRATASFLGMATTLLAGAVIVGQARRLGHGSIWLEYVSNIFIVGLVILLSFSALRLFWLMIRQGAEKQKIIINEETTRDAFAQLDYSGLIAQRPGVFSKHPKYWVVSIAIVITLLFSTQIILAQDMFDNETRALVWIIVFLAILVICALNVAKYARFTKKQDVGYLRFAEANKFVYTEKGADVALVRALQQDGGVLGADRYNLHEQIDGIYRGYKFTLGNVTVPTQSAMVFGVLGIKINAVITNGLMEQVEDATRESPCVDRVEYDTNTVYYVMHDGIPADRADMIQLFQVFDVLIAIDSERDNG